MNENNIYPLTVTQDHYTGAYSGGKYTAWNHDPQDIPPGIVGEDTECCCTWAALENDKTTRKMFRFGVGDTIQEAIAALVRDIEERGEAPLRFTTNPARWSIARFASISASMWTVRLRKNATTTTVTAPPTYGATAPPESRALNGGGILNNCPNCGAPIDGALCSYCGTIFYDLANIEIGKLSFLRMRLGDVVNIFEAYPEKIDIRAERPDPVCFYADNRLLLEMPTETEYNVTISFRVRPNKDGILYTRLKKEEQTNGLET